MRLLHTVTFELEDFLDENRPPYAILSHTWEKQEEVTFENLRLPQWDYNGKRGAVKVKGCCTQARKDGYSWVWVDMCCIDRMNRGEESEGTYSRNTPPHLLSLSPRPIISAIVQYGSLTPLPISM